MSTDVIWSIVRNNSRFISKKRNVSAPFSIEDHNLTGKHTARYSGFVNQKSISISPAKVGFNFSMRKSRTPNRPRGGVKTTLMKAGPRRSLHKIKSLTVKQRYRKDLAKAAMRKASAIIRSQKPLPSRKGANKSSKKTE